jgi:hypothetical protein
MAGVDPFFHGGNEYVSKEELKRLIAAQNKLLVISRRKLLQHCMICAM